MTASESAAPFRRLSGSPSVPRCTSVTMAVYANASGAEE